MKTIFLFSAFASLAAVGGAQPAAPPPGGDVTRQQVIERSDQHFRQMDADNDGRFTPQEAQALRAQHRTRMQQRMFDRLDGNRDGSISREEFAAAHEARGEGRGGHRAMRGHRGGRFMGMRHHGGPGGPGGPGMDMGGGRLFGEQGFVTREQFRERALTRFDRLDADHDGTLTAAERRGGHGRMRGAMHGPAAPTD